jgi:hypothetical protein
MVTTIAKTYSASIVILQKSTRIEYIRILYPCPIRSRVSLCRQLSIPTHCSEAANNSRTTQSSAAANTFQKRAGMDDPVSLANASL